MTLSDVGSIASIIGVILAILLGVTITYKLVINKSKKVGRDDNRINFGDNAKVKGSFNKENSFIKKGE